MHKQDGCMCFYNITHPSYQVFRKTRGNVGWLLEVADSIARRERDYIYSNVVLQTYEGSPLI